MVIYKHGGAREGAGRPRQDPNGEQRRKHSIYCTEKELKLLRETLIRIRENQYQISNKTGKKVKIIVMTEKNQASDKIQERSGDKS